MLLSLRGIVTYAQTVAVRLELHGDPGGEELCSQEHHKEEGDLQPKSTPFTATLCFFKVSCQVYFILMPTGILLWMREQAPRDWVTHSALLSKCGVLGTDS